MYVHNNHHHHHHSHGFNHLHHSQHGTSYSNGSYTNTTGGTEMAPTNRSHGNYDFVSNDVTSIGQNFMTNNGHFGSTHDQIPSYEDPGTSFNGQHEPKSSCTAYSTRDNELTQLENDQFKRYLMSNYYGLSSQTPPGVDLSTYPSMYRPGPSCDANTYAYTSYTGYGSHTPNSQYSYQPIKMEATQPVIVYEKENSDCTAKAVKRAKSFDHNHHHHRDDASSVNMDFSHEHLLSRPPKCSSNGGGGGNTSDESEFRNGATLRERNRMHILNDAFDELRKIVPKTNLSEHQRLSKIATLRLAIQYIAGLTKLLQNSGGCKPIDPSLLPPPPRRRRRRKMQKTSPPTTDAITEPTIQASPSVNLNKKQQLNLKLQHQHHHLPKTASN